MAAGVGNDWVAQRGFLEVIKNKEESSLGDVGADGIQAVGRVSTEVPRQKQAHVF